MRNVLKISAHIVLSLAIYLLAHDYLTIFVSTRSKLAIPLTITAFCTIALTFTVIVITGLLDLHLRRLQISGKESVNSTSSHPVCMEIAIVGGRNSGKTVFMAGAYWEWTTVRSTRNIKVKYAANSNPDGADNLEAVAKNIYTKRQFPSSGTVTCRQLPFELSYVTAEIDKCIAHFSLLDYPGGATTADQHNIDKQSVIEFWERIPRCDGLMLVVDGSSVRRGLREDNFLEVLKAYEKAMEILIDRNGRNRLIPVALILTKCDEFSNSGLDKRALWARFNEYDEYNKLERYWRELSSQKGPGIVEFSKWATTAVTNSQPATDQNGPFSIADPPALIKPTCCAAPIIWITAKIMRWNITLFRDYSSWLCGGIRRIGLTSPIMDLEKFADEGNARYNA